MNTGLWDEVIIIGQISGIKDSLVVKIGYQEIIHDTNDFLKTIRDNFEERLRGHGNFEVLATIFYKNIKSIEVYKDIFSRSQSTREELISLFEGYRSKISEELFFISYDQAITLIIKILGIELNIVEYCKGVEVANRQLEGLNKKQNDEFNEIKNKEKNISEILNKIREVESIWIKRYFENQKKIDEWKSEHSPKTGFIQKLSMFAGKAQTFNYENELIIYRKKLGKSTFEELPRSVFHKCKDVPSIRKEIAFFRSDDVEGISLHERQRNCQTQIQLFIKKMEGDGKVYLEGNCNKCQIQVNFNHANLKHVHYIFKDL
jgi:hypothetical protein